MNQLQGYINSLTTKELKGACQHFYRRAEAGGEIADMLVFNETFEQLRTRLTSTDFKAYCVSL